MHLTRLWLTDVRSYEHAELAPAPGLTAILGPNGSGKTNLLEAVGWLATLSSFRGAPTAAMVRHGCARAVLRAEVAGAEGRGMLIEAELQVAGRDRVRLNHQPLRRARDLLGVLRVTIFSPDDLELLKGGPVARRRYLDEVLVALSPRAAALCNDVERIVRQRTALLRQAGGRLSAEVATTLDVWDAKLAEAGGQLGQERADLVERLGPVVDGSYAALAGAGVRSIDPRRPGEGVVVTYDAPWSGVGLAAALAAARGDDVRRGVCTVGPHRDDLGVRLAGLPARTHASQGEQRTLALALRLASHRVVHEATGAPPVLLLDDVFSELDAERSAALLANLPGGQALLTTAGALPPGATPDEVVRVVDGGLVPEAA